MKPATYLSALVLLIGAVAAAGCSSSKDAEHATGDTLTIYTSLPHYGTSARIGVAVAAGARLALRDAGGHAGGKALRLVELDSSKPGGDSWDPSIVEANAKRAADDPTAIAYLGELDEGASAVSVPVTNDKDILQVSPGDGLTSLTRDEPGAPVATGPDRYYPSGRRSFLRLVPTDYQQAATLVGLARDHGARRVVLVQDERLFGRELADQARNAAAKLGVTVADVVEVRDDPAGYPALATEVAQSNPDAVIYTGLGDPPAGPALAAIELALPGTALYGGSALATSAPVPPHLPRALVVKPALPVSEYGPRARRVMARLRQQEGSAVAIPEALYGYEAMRLVLDALNTAGKRSGDRLAVMGAALAPRARMSVIGDYRVVPGGDVSTRRFGSYRRSPAGMPFEGVREPPGGSH